MPKRRERPAPILDWIEGDPPPTKNGLRHHKKRVGYTSPTITALKAWPGRWAIVYRTETRSSATARASYLKLQGCEATTRGARPDAEQFLPKVWSVYARWVMTITFSPPPDPPLRYWELPRS